jgi:ectoine hydroxylase-related dioxygenase (phytanoyl-CoA dioxygenase family)
MTSREHDRIIEQEAATIRDQGYVIIERLLDAPLLAELCAALAPYLDQHRGRNSFEGRATERVYTLVARHRVFQDLAEHPRILGLCQRFLQPGYLLTASQAISIHPGEQPQAWHTDDSFYAIPRPRPAISVSVIFAIDDFTAENGATRLVPGSHLLGDDVVARINARLDFTPGGHHGSEGPGHESTGAPGHGASAPLDALASALANAPTDAPTNAPTDASPAAELADSAIAAVMPAGSAIVFLGTLVHGGGANRSADPRLALSNQYCQPWARQQENYALAVPPELVREMSPRVRALLGYSIHPPFMGHVGGLHPERLLARREGSAS